MEQNPIFETKRERWADLFKPKAAGWIIDEGSEKGVRVAPWVIEEQKKALRCSLVGFLKTKSDRLPQVELWLERS